MSVHLLMPPSTPSTLIIRVRSNLGLHRIALPLEPGTPLPCTSLYSAIAHQLSQPVLMGEGVSLTAYTLSDPSNAKFIPEQSSSNLLARPYSMQNGTMVYCFFEEGTVIPPPPRSGVSSTGATLGQVSANSAPPASQGPKKLKIGKGM